MRQQKKFRSNGERGLRTGTVLDSSWPDQYTEAAQIVIRGKECEANVPTESPQTETYARISHSDEDARRTQGTEATASEGPEAPNGVGRWPPQWLAPLYAY